MHVSLSEVEAIVAKAAMGVGLPAGLGEDAGRAATLMLRSGLGALSDLAGALDAVDGGASAGFDTDRVAARRLVPANGAAQLSALRAGPTACDLLLAAAGSAGGDDGRDTTASAAVETTRPRGIRGPGSRNVVTLTAVDYPTVVLHHVLDVSRSIDTPLRVAWLSPGAACPVWTRASRPPAKDRFLGARASRPQHDGGVGFSGITSPGDDKHAAAARMLRPERHILETAYPVGTRASRPRSNMGAPRPAAWPAGEGVCIEVVCRNGTAELRSGAPAGVSGPGPAEMSIGFLEALSDREAGASGDDGAGGEIEDATWRRLCAYAERRLVESTERSRLDGAGAGVVDTD